MPDDPDDQQDSSAKPALKEEHVPEDADKHSTPGESTAARVNPAGAQKTPEAQEAGFPPDSPSQTAGSTDVAPAPIPEDSTGAPATSHVPAGAPSGHSLSEATTEPHGSREEASPDTESPASPPLPARPVHCTRCGAEMRQEDRFCHACGATGGVPAPGLPARAPVNPSDYSRLAAFLLCLLIGFVGAHRFYVGKIGTGILWLFTLGFLFVGQIYDLVLIATGEFRDIDNRRLLRWSD